MMLGEGLLNKQIAFKLGVSEATIKAHVSAILQKLGVDSRTQAVIAISKIGAHRRLAARPELTPIHSAQNPLPLMRRCATWGARSYRTTSTGISLWVRTRVAWLRAAVWRDRGGRARP